GWLRARRAGAVGPAGVPRRAGRGEGRVVGHGAGELVGGIYHGDIDLIAIHVREASPGVVGPHPPIVDGLTLRRRQVAIDAHESTLRVGAPDLSVHEPDDVAPGRLGVDGAPLAVLRIDPLVSLVDLDHVAV